MTCQAINDQAFLGSVLTHIDCQARTLGDGGYHALSQPGSTGAAILVATLTIYIAIIGYQLLLGGRFGTREIVMLAVKLGAALLLATSWSAVKPLLYDVVVDGPAELARQIGGGTGLPGLQGDMLERLQLVDWEMDELDQRGSGVVSPDTAGQTATGTRRRIDLPSDFSRLGMARLLFLSSTIAAIAVVRLTGGILLALAPIFSLLLLFDTARSLFFGWLRGLIVSLVGGVFVIVTLSVELALLEPWLDSLVDLRRMELTTPSAPLQLLALVLVFAGALASLLYVAIRISQSLTERARVHFEPPMQAASIRKTASALPSAIMGTIAEGSSTTVRSRALEIADAVSRISKSHGERTIPVTTTRPGQQTPSPLSMPIHTPLGQSFRRRTQGRASSSMARRNRI